MTRRGRQVLLMLVLGAGAFGSSGAARAQAPAQVSVSEATLPVEGESSAAGADLAQKLSNPVANLITVPFQNNVDCCFGPEDGARYTLNIQPVIPVSVSADWNMIIRTILPVIYQERTVAGGSDAFGIGDITQSFFFSPKQSRGGFIWGAGPVFLYPAGESALGSEKWGIGPTAVVLRQSGTGVTIGALANHIWSVAGDDARPDISSSFFQLFFAKAWPDSTTFSVNTETTYDWLRDAWTVPVNVGLSHIYPIGKQPVQLGVTGRYYLASPDGGPEWGVRLSITLLFPG